MTLTNIVNEKGETVIGVLTEKTRDKIVLIVHGEQGHKNSLYQESLAEELPYSSFRFDFIGDSFDIIRNTETIYTVANYFEKLGYEIFAIIAYSLGSLSGLKYATTCDKPLLHYINIATPFDTMDIIENLKLSKSEFETIVAWDNSHVVRVPKTTCVYTIHGIHDKVVPAYHAANYSNKIPNHTLTLIPNADHEFTEQQPILVQSILDHFEKHERDAYQKALLMGQHVSLVIPRWIDVEGVKNFRDIGGWPLKDGTGYIRERTVFRCGHLVNVTEKGIKTLKRLNVVAAFDFRSETEIEKQGTMPEIEGLQRYPSALFSRADYSPAALASRWKGYFEGATGFPKVYATILEKGAFQYRKIFIHLIENHSIESTESIIIHCTAGKDRTGIFGMLLLGLCGVDDEIISNEYALSNLGYWEPEHELQKKAELLNVTIEDMRMVMSAPYAGMKETIRQLKEKYGSIEGYVRKECQLTDEQIQRVRDLMIVPIRFEERQLYRPKI